MDEQDQVNNILKQMMKMSSSALLQLMVIIVQLRHERKMQEQNLQQQQELAKGGPRDMVFMETNFQNQGMPLNHLEVFESSDLVNITEELKAKQINYAVNALPDGNSEIVFPNKDIDRANEVFAKHLTDFHSNSLEDIKKTEAENLEKDISDQTTPKPLEAIQTPAPLPEMSSQTPPVSESVAVDKNQKPSANQPSPKELTRDQLLVEMDQQASILRESGVHVDPTLWSNQISQIKAGNFPQRDGNLLSAAEIVSLVVEQSKQVVDTSQNLAASSAANTQTSQVTTEQVSSAQGMTVESQARHSFVEEMNNRRATLLEAGIPIDEKLWDHNITNIRNGRIPKLSAKDMVDGLAADTKARNIPPMSNPGLDKITRDAVRQGVQQDIKNKVDSPKQAVQKADLHVSPVRG